VQSSPIVTVKDVSDLTGTALPAGNDLVSRLVDLAIPVETTRNARHRRFRWAPRIELFCEPARALGNSG